MTSTPFFYLPLDTLQYHLLPFLKDKEIALLAITSKWCYQTLVIRTNDFIDESTSLQTCLSDRLWERLVKKRWKSVSFPGQLDIQDIPSINGASRSSWHLEYFSRAEKDSLTLSMITELLDCVKHKSERMDQIWVKLLCEGYAEGSYDMLRSLSGERSVDGKVYVPSTIEQIAEDVMVGVHRFNICKKFQNYAKSLGGQQRNEKGTNLLSLEDGAILIAEFCQKEDDIKAHYDNNVTVTEYVDQELTSIAETLTLRMKERVETESFSVLDVIIEMQTFFIDPSTETIDVSESNDTLRPFSGNQVDYYNSKNSLLDEVIRSRKGIPLTLSMVYAGIVNRAVGLQLEPVGLPGHFLLSTKISHEDDSERRIFIDPYNGGKVLNEEDCIAIVRHYGIPWNVSK